MKRKILSLLLIFSLKWILLAPSIYGQGVTINLIPNVLIKEFTNASGMAEINLEEGIISLRGLKGFPINPRSGHPVPINLTTLFNPSYRDSMGNLIPTICAGPKADGTWSCHTHAYIVWLLSVTEDGSISHPVPLGVILPRKDGTVKDRVFDLGGDLAGFAPNLIVITGENTFNPPWPIEEPLSMNRQAPQGPPVLYGIISEGVVEHVH